MPKDIIIFICRCRKKYTKCRIKRRKRLVSFSITGKVQFRKIVAAFIFLFCIKVPFKRKACGLRTDSRAERLPNMSNVPKKTVS